MLDGLNIVEIGEGMAVQVAGLMLAELGADVLKIERESGDPSRGTASFANWNRAKRSLLLDMDSVDGRAELFRRLSGADVLLHQFTPSRARALGLDDGSLAQSFPQLVVCAITGSPIGHPDVERSDDELLVAARVGAMYENDGHRAGPIVYRFRQGSWSAAHLAVSGILARLVARLQNGRGGAAHTSIMQGFLASFPLVWGRNSKGPMPNTQAYPLAPRPTAIQLFECQGGEWLQAMDPTRQFDFASLPTMWSVLAEDGVDISTEAGLQDAFRRRPRDMWIADLQAADIAVEAVLPMGEMLRHPEVVANGYVAEVSDPYLGRTIQPAMPVTVEQQCPRARPAPRPGEGGDLTWATTFRPGLAGDPPAELLEGVRVLDLGMFVAGPLAPALLGDMGADVIKVEALSGDRLRFMHRYFQAAARSKRGLALDLSRPEAQEILGRLMRWAELVHHNMRFKGANKLGLGLDAIRAHNPDASFNYVSAYGQKGSRGNWPGYDSIFNAIAGWEYENAGIGNRPVFNRPGTMDVVTALNALVAMMASLYAQRAHGKAQATQCSMLGVSAFTQGEVLLKSDGTLSETYRLNAAQTGFSPWHRIYECAGGQWIAVAARRDREKAALGEILGSNPDSFADAASRWDATLLLAALDAASVPADLVNFTDAMNRFFDDPLNRELGLSCSLPHATYGDVEQAGAFWNFGDVPLRLKRSCPEIGEHSDEILRELGYLPEEITAFRNASIIG